MNNRININNNELSIKDLSIPAVSCISPEVIIKAVRSGFKYENGVATKEIDHIKYDVVNPHTYDRFTIKVPGATPVITTEQLESASPSVVAHLPVDQIQVSPYIDKKSGKLKVTITSPQISIVKKQQQKEA